MKPKILLRIASGLMLLHTIGHTMGALTWTEAPNAAIGKVISAMQNNHFDFMGKSVTLASFFSGYGITMIFVLLFITVLLWLMAYEITNRLCIHLMVPLTALLLAMAVTEYIYFFPLPMVLTLLAGLCTLFARMRMKE
jgi:cobalamin biosynthesis protein CobD/CbiB